MHEMKMRRCPHLIFLLFLSHFATWSLCPYASAQVPKLIRYQGTLTDTNNVPLEGPHALTFRLYGAETGGQALWTETQTVVSVTRGVFNVLLGQTTSLNVPFDKDYWLTTQVGTDAEMSPRQRLTSVPYAIRAEEAERLAEQPPHFAVDTAGTLPNGLVAYWTLDEAGGGRADSKGSHHLTDHNTVTQAAGKQGHAAQFTSANSEYLSIADNAYLSVGDIDFSIAAWVYLDDISWHRGILGKWDEVVSQKEYNLRHDTGNLHFFVSSNGSAEASVNTPSALSTGAWHLIVAWHDSVANTINLQVDNGTVYSTSHASGVVDGPTTFKIGNIKLGVDVYMNGRVDQVGFWKRVLTAQERADLYNTGVGNTYLPGGFYLESSLTGKRYRLVTEELP